MKNIILLIFIFGYGQLYSQKKEFIIAEENGFQSGNHILSFVSDTTFYILGSKKNSKISNDEYDSLFLYSFNLEKDLVWKKLLDVNLMIRGIKIIKSNDDILILSRNNQKKIYQEQSKIYRVSSCGYIKRILQFNTIIHDFVEDEENNIWTLNSLPTESQEVKQNPHDLMLSKIDSFGNEIFSKWLSTYDGNYQETRLFFNASNGSLTCFFRLRKVENSNSKNVFHTLKTSKFLKFEVFSLDGVKYSENEISYHGTIDKIFFNNHEDCFYLLNPYWIQKKIRYNDNIKMGLNVIRLSKRGEILSKREAFICNKIINNSYLFIDKSQAIVAISTLTSFFVIDLNQPNSPIIEDYYDSSISVQLHEIIKIKNDLFGICSVHNKIKSSINKHLGFYKLLYL